jgi:hypothetical protein
LLVNPNGQDVTAAFDELDRDAHGVLPVDMHRFMRSRLPEPEANENFHSILSGRIAREQLAERLALPRDAITDLEVNRLRHMYSLWYRWASDDAEGWIVSGASRGGGVR